MAISLNHMHDFNTSFSFGLHNTYECRRHCTSGLPSDITVEIGELSFHLHKFPLLSRSGVLEKHIGEFSTDDGSICVVQFHDIPGGAKAFELIAKFCYGVKIELTALNVVGLRCAAEYLQMNEDYGERNLISQTEGFLNEVFGNWADTIKALKTCEEVLQFAEELHIFSRCINSLATKACADTSLFNWPLISPNNTESTNTPVLWNGIYTTSRPQPMGDDWWYEDVSFLSLPLYKRLILAVELGGMKPEKIAGSLMFYAKKHLPLMNKQLGLDDANPGLTTSIPSEADQRALLEEIVELLPYQKGVIQSKFLLRLLRISMAHPWFTDSEREQICRLMNCQKLSLEASTHAAQNERLPLRVIVQVLFFEQLRLRTSISGWFSVSDSLDNYQNPNANLALTAQDRAAAVEDVRERISDLEKECQTMRCEIQKLVKTKRSWNIFCRRKSQNGNSTESKASSLKAPPPALVKEREKS
ncbi:hypothetical protein C3L33_12405, partial [Rhododendron williamsianum]